MRDARRLLWNWPASGPWIGPVSHFVVAAQALVGDVEHEARDRG
jgi:hypothetical protein